jgi:uncharacterized protein
MTRFSSALVLLAFLIPAGSALAGAGSDPAARGTISVRGEASVAAVPDRVELTVGHNNRAQTAAAAVAANSAAMEKIFAVLRDSGIAARDMRTAGFSVSPVTTRPDRNAAPRIVSYRVSNRVVVVLRDRARLGELLDTLTQAGANRINGIRFLIGETEKLADRARRKAVEDARRKARLYADTAGVTLGRVLKITERSVYVPGPRAIRESAIQTMSRVPIAAGEQRIGASITVTFAIKQAGD